MKSRILKFLEEKHLSTLAFEKSIGASNGYFRNTKNISADVCSRILATYPELSAEWLLKGEGEMLLKEEPKMNYDKSLLDTIKTLQDVINMKNETIAMLEERIKQLENKLK